MRVWILHKGAGHARHYALYEERPEVIAVPVQNVAGNEAISYETPEALPIFILCGPGVRKLGLDFPVGEVHQLELNLITAPPA